MSFEVPVEGGKESTEDPKVKKAIEGLNKLVGSENKIKGAGVEEGTLEGKHLKSETAEGKHLKKDTVPREKLAADAKGIVGTFYTPKLINTEESRTNTAFGTLTTPDEIPGVVVPENGLLVVGYVATVKSSVASAGKVALFLGANQAKSVLEPTGAPAGQETTVSGTGFQLLFSSGGGFVTAGSERGTSQVSTGQFIGTSISGPQGGLAVLFAAAGTYAISVQYRATSGSITAKERKLWAYVIGG